MEVDGHRLRVKVSPGRVKVEHADAARVAAMTGQPLSEVAARAEAAWRQRAEDAGPGRGLLTTFGSRGGPDHPDATLMLT